MDSLSRKRPPHDSDNRSVRTTGDAARSRPDLAHLADLYQHLPVLHAHGIDMRRSVAMSELDIVDEVWMDKGVKVSVVGPGEALKTGGVCTCYALCARAVLDDGRTLVGMAHVSMCRRGVGAAELAKFEVARLMVEMTQEMRNNNSTEQPVQIFIAGGAVSRVREDNSNELSADGSIHLGMHLLEAASKWLVSARIGLSEVEHSNADLTSYKAQGYIVGPPTTLPDSVSVFVTRDGVIVTPCTQDHTVGGFDEDEGDLSDKGDEVESAKAGPGKSESDEEGLATWQDQQQRPDWQESKR